MKILSGNRGFTLIEIIICIVILGLASGILIPFIQSVRGSVGPVFTQQADALVQGELEQVMAQRRANGFASFVTGSTTCVIPMLAGFTPCIRTVCSVPAANLNDLTNCAMVSNFKRVQVTITHGVIGDVSAVMLLANY